MKLSTTLLTLGALHGAAAFVIPTSSSSRTALSVSYLDEVERSGAGQVPPFSGAAASPPPPPSAQMQKAPNSNAPFYANAANAADSVQSIWDTSRPVTIQGGSLATLSLSSPLVERVQVSLKTEGRPLNANVDLWHGPDNTPQTMGIYIEDGAERPFNAVIETPRGSNSIAIRNTGHMEFPMAAVVEAEIRDSANNGLTQVTRRLADLGNKRIVQGGAVMTYPFAPSVGSVQVLLRTDGRPLNARVELLQGPNNNKQVVEFFSEDGMERPLFMVIETPGVGNVVRIVNTAPMEFPLTATVEAYMEEPGYDGGPIGADGWSFGGQ